MDAAQEVKSRLDVVDIVQEYLPMKPAGTGSFKGACPFHQENTPSFFTNRPRQSWHCFGCDEGGDLIDFVMRMEGMEFREALELLAQKAGVTLPSYKPQERSQKKRLHEINDLTSKWFRMQLLKNPEADHARKYAESRDLDSLTCDLWGIGYAPDSWDLLITDLQKEGVNDKELILAGLASPRSKGGGVYSRFRDRLMFTIRDQHGNVVGFTGRLLSKDAKEAKYVNSPETEVYKKSEILFGLDKAKGSIKKNDLAVIVEGNMDVISSHKNEVENVIASSGTALTEQQLRLIKRYTNNLAFAFDADKGGIAAAKRGVDIARGMGFHIRMILLPEDAGKDPDDAIQKDVQIWKDSISNAPEYTEWLYKIAFRTHGGHDPQTKKAIAQALLPEFIRILDPVERDSWIVRLAEDLSVAPSALRDAISKAKRNTNKPKYHKAENTSQKEDKSTPVEKSRSNSLKEQLMAILLIKPELRELAESILNAYTPASDEITKQSSYLAILADREFEEQSLASLTHECERISIMIMREINGQKRQNLEKLMAEAERSGDTERIKSLITEFQKLS